MLLADCTVAGLINAALAVEALASNSALAFDAESWMPFYAALAGCAPTPAAIAATEGLVLLDVLRAQGTKGFDIGAQAPLTGDFGTVPLNRAALAGCMARLGFVYLGVDLYQADMDSHPNDTWDTIIPAGAPVGGHCLVLWAYTGLDADGIEGDDLVKIATWGTLKTATWRWVENRAREAYAILYPAIEAPGVDVAALKAANARWLSA